MTKTKWSEVTTEDLRATLAYARTLDETVLAAAAEFERRTASSASEWLPISLRVELEAAVAPKPGAACPRCGGWTSFGGMSQHASGPDGCSCFGGTR